VDDNYAWLQAADYGVAYRNIVLNPNGGDVLVGKTTTALGTAGLTFGAAGFASLTRDGAEPLNVNRLSSAGNLAVFYKDGTTVGSIGVNDDKIIFGTANAAIAIDQSSNIILPYNPATPGARDAAIDLGYASGRFKDLYLSGVMAAGNGSATAPSVRGTDTNTGLFFPSGGVTAITRNGVEAMRISSNGTVAINSTATNRELTISSVTGGGQCDLALRASDDNNFCQLLFGDTSADNTGIVGYKNGDEFMFFNTNGQERLRIDGDGVAHFNGDVKVLSGDIQMGNGRGINFSATADSSGTMSSETLDDYEEGTFTASLSAYTTDPTITEGKTFTAYYTKVGRKVTVTGYSGTKTITNVGAGGARITGLPFANMGGAYGVVVMAHNTMFGTHSGYVESGSSYWLPIVEASSSGVAYTTGSKYFMFQTTYFAS